jgi:hypothetical protein
MALPRRTTSNKQTRRKVHGCRGHDVCEVVLRRGVGAVRTCCPEAAVTKVQPWLSGCTTRQTSPACT